MVGTAILLTFLLAAVVTDIRWRKIHNWTTYPGILVAFVASAIATWFHLDDVQGSNSEQAIWGFVPIADSLTGFFACGIAMLFCYVFFPGGVGGGDVKLISMIGAYLGLYAGLEAMLWTFILGACQALITLIWRHGAIELLYNAVKRLWFAVRWGGATGNPDAEKTETAAVNMFLSPSALIAVLIVRFHLLEWLHW